MVLRGILGRHTLRLTRPWFSGVGKPPDRPPIGGVPPDRAFARRKTTGIIGRRMGRIILAGSIPLHPFDTDNLRLTFEPLQPPPPRFRQQAAAAIGGCGTSLCR